eukprot:1187826-Prorocentrum_minimum.AAC.1
MSREASVARGLRRVQPTPRVNGSRVPSWCESPFARSPDTPRTRWGVSLGFFGLPLFAHLLGGGDHQNGHGGSVLGRQLRRGAVRGEHHDETREDVLCCLNRGAHHTLDDGHGLGGEVAHEADSLLPVDALLGVASDGRHGGHRLRGEGPVGGLAREHGGVASVEDSVGHIRHLRARGQR